MVDILELINTHPGLNKFNLQNRLQAITDFDTIFNKLISDGYLLKESLNSDEHYYLNNEGLAYLEKLQAISFTKSKTNNKVSNALILVSDKFINDKLACLLEFSNELVIQRLINQLADNEVNTIYVCTNKPSYFTNILNNEVNVITYDDISKISLLDTIVVNAELVIENVAMHNFINYVDNNSYLVSNNTKAIKSKYLNYIDKSNTNDLVGIIKLSSEYISCLKQLTKLSLNELSLDKEFKAYGSTHLLALSLLDTQAYELLNNKLGIKLISSDKEFKFRKLTELLTKILKINEADILSIQLMGGLTNNNFKVETTNQTYALRMPGIGTSKMINRQDEVYNSKYANKLGIDAKLIYFDESTGIKLSEYVEGAITLNSELVQNYEILDKVAKLLRRLHESNGKMLNEFNVFDKIVEYENLIDELGLSYLDNYQAIRKQVIELKTLVSYELKPCHNDALAENFIMSSKGNIYLIDWEYSGMNDPMWDLAAFSLECELNNEYETYFYEAYFNGSLDHKAKTSILINKIYQDFLWTNWAILKCASGSDLVDYANERYSRCISNLKLINKGE